MKYQVRFLEHPLRDSPPVEQEVTGVFDVELDEHWVTLTDSESEIIFAIPAGCVLSILRVQEEVPA